MGLFSAALWAVPLALFRFVIFTDGQYNRAFIGVFSWACAINGITLVLNFADKILACCGNKEKRVPEAILHACTLLGGGPATVFAMVFFWHKISKGSYQISFLVMSCFSLLFIGGAYGLAYGLEYHLSKITNTTLPITTFSTPTTFKTTMSGGFLSTATQVKVSPSTIEEFTSMVTNPPSASDFSTMVSNLPVTNASNVVTETIPMVTENVTESNVITASSTPIDSV